MTPMSASNLFVDMLGQIAGAVEEIVAIAGPGRCPAAA